MKELGYYNGKIGELSEMTVPMNDRACWFGDGVYEAGMCRNGRISPWTSTWTGSSAARRCSRRSKRNKNALKMCRSPESGTFLFALREGFCYNG